MRLASSFCALISPMILLASFFAPPPALSHAPVASPAAFSTRASSRSSAPISTSAASTSRSTRFELLAFFFRALSRSHARSGCAAVASARGGRPAESARAGVGLWGPQAERTEMQGVGVGGLRTIGGRTG